MTSAHTDRFSVSVSAIVLASVLSSLGWIFEGEAVARLSPLTVVCVSLLMSGTILVSWGYFRSRSSISVLRSALSFRFVLFSIIRSAFVSLVFGFCLTLTSSTKIMFLTKIEPYVVLLIQMLFYGHRTSAQHVILLGVHIFGAVILSTGGQFAFTVDTWGDLLILLAIIVNAALYTPSHGYAHTLGALYASGSSQLIGGLVLLPPMLFFSLGDFSHSSAHTVGWLYVLATVLVFYVFSNALFFFSLKGIPAWLASALRCVGPVVAAPIAWFVFQKPLTLVQCCGAFLVVATSMWMVILERRA